MPAVLVILLILVTWPVAASPKVDRTERPYPCEQAVARADPLRRIPAGLLMAIALTESGRLEPLTGAMRPWPWTINAEGAGQFFSSKAEAIAAVRNLQARGVRSIDVGCMQVNLVHHPNAFASLDEAFDPATNARYAARFLMSLYGVTGNWLQAAGSYHSETPALHMAYRTAVLKRWQAPGGSVLSQGGTPYRSFAPVQQTYGAFASSGRSYARTARPYPLAPTVAITSVAPSRR